MKTFCLILCLFPVLFTIISSTNIDCTYQIYTFFVIGPTYYCKVSSNLNITSPELAAIDSASDNHTASKFNDDVFGFWAENKTINFFPQNLDKIFKNLKLIVIMHGKINEIHQDDLKPFPQLEYLNLHNNTIEVLEEGLFDFNPNLAFISFANNKLYKIHPEVFDKLTKLSFLFLDANKCVDKLAKDDYKALSKAIKEVKFKCLNDTITTTTSTTTEMSRTNQEKLMDETNSGSKFELGFFVILGLVLSVLNC
ncbi:hypothetical protein ACKWTF_015150 [Chironomus riparius]